MQKRTKRHQMFGFTLLELLVVISIIGILVAMGVAAFTNAQQKSRNARRRADMKSIQTAMEQYYSQNDSAYPNTCAGVGDILSPFPSDPREGAYPCSVDTVANTYCACATLEAGETGNSSSANTNCSGLGGSGSYFCVKNLQ